MQAGTTLQIETTGDTDLSHATLKGQDITLSTPAHLEANGTDIVAAASIRIDADSLDHREGQFIAGQDLNVTVAHTLHQDQSLWIAHRQLNAQSQTHSIEGNSTLYGAEGIVLDSSDRLEVTEGSRLITDSNLTVNTDTLHLDNASLYAQQHAQITAAHITNRHHSSITSANAVIGTQTLDNADSNLSSAGGTLSIHTSDTLNNNHGLLSANGNLIITAQSLDTRNGEMEAGNTLDVTSAQMQIENSRFFAGNHLAVNSNISSIDAGTQFLSLNSMDLRFAGGLTNHGEITSNNIHGTESNITVNGDLNNEANITASGTLNIKAHNLTNNLHDTNASIKGGGESTVTLTGDLNNSGFLSSRGDLTLTAQNVTNTGGIATGRDLTIESHTLHNYNTLFSSRDMNLYIRDLLSNHEDAIIYAGQDLTIAKNAAGDKTTKIENLAARIESGRDMNISAVTLENIGTVDINYTVNYYNTVTEQNMTRAEMEAWMNEEEFIVIQGENDRLLLIIGSGIMASMTL
jgi:filamentous hemagglutinin